MQNIPAMEQLQRIRFPPINSLMPDMKIVNLDFCLSADEDNDSGDGFLPNDDSDNNSIANANKSSCSGTSKTPQYTLEDDLIIFKTINSYYGTAFHGRVPWSFWQTFRKVTGNERSSSSLYHHWNGAMRRKYGTYLSAGRIHDCIAWIEQALSADKSPSAKAQDDKQITGHPLQHNWSLPPRPLQEIKEDLFPDVK
ncbi:hypothetical protein TRFO_37076 [Tritrichomonas foetus]|uniref:Myb-like domain-containing protein n=1 Tax=Tritrichomonas foetus TaxID=1144522 RepID=A0A1J4JEK4_9EUKA|nr:hypothetical protein TRFO_37076 [Tritrichomonas foetus]|eukprot:OHS96727.1 hypothetical protein TRFO_37076 [Tritrichomonas foetus]